MGRSYMGSTPKKAKPSQAELRKRKKAHKDTERVVQTQHQQLERLAQNIVRLSETLATPRPQRYYFTPGLPNKKQFRAELRKVLSAAETGITVEVEHKQGPQEVYIAKFKLPNGDVIENRIDENHAISQQGTKKLPALEKVVSVVLKRMN
jgi:hypothetical protein